MGTSQSASNPSAKIPLVPASVDDRKDELLPEPQPNRFNSFRRNVSKFVSTGDKKSLNRALGHYSRTSTGGSNVAVRRYGDVTKAGANLFGFLTGRQIGNVAININSLSGLPPEKVINAIVDNLSSISVDGEKIRIAMNEALADALSGVAIFNPEEITDDIVIDVMISYLTENIFLQVIMDSSDSWNKAKNVMDGLREEETLRELIKTLVDEYISNRLKGDIRKFSHSKILEIERDVIIDVWNAWGEYQ